MTEAQRLKIIALLTQGLTEAVVAQRFGVSQSYIHLIRTGQRK